MRETDYKWDGQAREDMFFHRIIMKIRAMAQRKDILFPMDNYMENYNEYMNNLERMYPDVHKRLEPHAKEIADTMHDEDIDSMTHADLHRMSEEVMRRGNIDGNMPAGHSVETVGDIARGLILGSLLGRGIYDYDYPYPYPYPYYPVFPFFGGRRFRHGFGGHRGRR